MLKPRFKLGEVPVAFDFIILITGGQYSSIPALNWLNDGQAAKQGANCWQQAWVCRGKAATIKATTTMPGDEQAEQVA